MKKLFSMMFILSLVIVVAGCSLNTNSEGKTKRDTITIAWLPNESGADQGEARAELGRIIEEATGMKVEHKTTTDYIIAVESVANGNADLAFLGAQAYIEAHNKNNKVLPLVVPSGKSGTLEDAVYYSWLAVKKGNEGQYKAGNGFTIDPIAGQKFSFVSNSSTSGFKVPASGIVSYFSQKDQYKDLKSDDLLEGGQGKFFSEVYYGGSHQGSAVNLFSGKADVAAFCDVCVVNYVDLAEGKENRPGALYKVKENADEPFNTFPGEEFILISVTPVLNAPFVVNTERVSQETTDKLTQILTSDSVTNNEKIFVPKDSEFSGLFGKKSTDERFLKVEDAWFNPIRELSN